MEKNRGIYSITNKNNNKIYIGSALNISNRWKIHLCQLRNNKHHSSYLQRSFNLLSEEFFIFKILEIIKDKNKLIEREQYYIDLYKSYDINFGYNMAPVAGSPIGTKRDNVVKEKLSKLWKKKYKDGYIHPMKGKTHSAETKEKQSISKIKKYKTEKHPRTDKKHTKESIKKMIGKNKGKNSAMFGKKGKCHPAYGKQLSGKEHPNWNTVALNAKSIILINEKGKEIPFVSIKECSEYLNVSRATIRNYINNKIIKNKYKIFIKKQK